jgi:hypothetical protein
MTTVILTLTNTRMSVALAFMTSIMTIGITSITIRHKKLEGYWPSYNYEADLQTSSQLESSQYEGHESNTEDSLIEEDEDEIVHDDGFSQ